MSFLWCHRRSCQGGGNLAGDSQFTEIDAPEKVSTSGNVHVTTSPAIRYNLCAVECSRLNAHGGTRPEINQLDAVWTDGDCVKAEEHRCNEEPTRDGTGNHVENGPTRSSEHRLKAVRKLRCHPTSAYQISDGTHKTNDAGGGHEIYEPVRCVIENLYVHGIRSALWLTLPTKRLLPSNARRSDWLDEV